HEGGQRRQDGAALLPAAGGRTEDRAGHGGGEGEDRHQLTRGGRGDLEIRRDVRQQSGEHVAVDPGGEGRHRQPDQRPEGDAAGCRLVAPAPFTAVAGGGRSARRPFTAFMRTSRTGGPGTGTRHETARLKTTASG